MILMLLKQNKKEAEEKSDVNNVADKWTTNNTKEEGRRGAWKATTRRQVPGL
jgi:hypothetical protein